MSSAPGNTCKIAERVRSSSKGKVAPQTWKTARLRRRVRMVQPVCRVSLTDTCTIERGIAGERADSHSVSLPSLPLTKYDDRYAAAFWAGWGLTCFGL